MCIESIKALLGRIDYLELVVGGIVGVIITGIFNHVVTSFHRKRREYCISKSLVSSSVYQQTDKDGLKIVISYKDSIVEGTISILNIRLRNDGAEDLVYSQRVSSLLLRVAGMEILDVTVSSDIDGVNPIVLSQGDGGYELRWDLLKRDECFYIKVVAKGEIKDISAIKFDIRAEGIDRIKTPEFMVNDEMRLIYVIAALFAIPIALFWPNSDSFIGIMPMKVFLLISLAFMTLLCWVSALLRRIKWLKEQ